MDYQQQVHVIMYFSVNILKTICLISLSCYNSGLTVLIKRFQSITQSIGTIFSEELHVKLQRKRRLGQFGHVEHNGADKCMRVSMQKEAEEEQHGMIVRQRI